MAARRRVKVLETKKMNQEEAFNILQTLVSLKEGMVTEAKRAIFSLQGKGERFFEVKVGWADNEALSENEGKGIMNAINLDFSRSGNGHRVRYCHDHRSLICVPEKEYYRLFTKKERKNGN